MVKEYCCWSAAKSTPALCDPVGCSTLGASVLRCLLESAQIHVCWVGDAVQSSHRLPPQPQAFSKAICIFASLLKAVAASMGASLQGLTTVQMSVLCGFHHLFKRQQFL